MSLEKKSLENRIGVGSRVYHLTAQGKLDYIEASCLAPMTYSSNVMSRKLGVGSRRHIVCGVTDDFSDWEKYGLLDHLIIHVQTFSSKISKLSFVLEDVKDCFAAEHSHVSPKRFVEVCGEDLWKKVKNRNLFGSLNKNQEKIWYKQNEKYDKSVVYVSEYKGDYELPEIWYPHAVHFDKITVEVFR